MNIPFVLFQISTLFRSIHAINLIAWEPFNVYGVFELFVGFYDAQLLGFVGAVGDVAVVPFYDFYAVDILLVLRRHVARRRERLEFSTLELRRRQKRFKRLD